MVVVLALAAAAANIKRRRKKTKNKRVYGQHALSAVNAATRITNGKK